MASRFSAARPKRASEAFARAHHGNEPDHDGVESPSYSGKNKKVKFDVRNPSALAPSAQDNDDEGEDEVLAADVIGGTRAMKRGAVNIDGYDSDSDNENFNNRAEARVKKGKEAEDVNFAEIMDNYGSAPKAPGQTDEDDEEIDMFGDLGDDDDEDGEPAKKTKQHKEVNFLNEDDIEGQEGESKSRGTIKIDNDGGSSSDDDDEEDIAAAIEEEGIDEEVGAGGLKKHAPKIDAFNMRQEQEEGRFDEAGNYIRKAADENEVHDRWLEGLSKKEIKKAAAAHEKREAELRKQQMEDDSIMTSDLLKSLILNLELGETALEALARLGKGLKKTKKMPKWKQKKQQQKAANGGDGDAMDIDAQKEPEDPKQTKLKEAVNAITESSDKLRKRDYPNIYDTERERLIREYRNQTGEEWVEPSHANEDDEKSGVESAASYSGPWEFRWVDGGDAAPTQGPFDGQMMKAWQDAGYFTEGAVEFRPAGLDGEWTKSATFI